MKERHLECVDRVTGAESHEVVVAESQADAFALVDKRGLMVAKVKRIVELPSAAAPDASTDPARTPGAWRRGEALAHFGAFFNLVGIIGPPCAMIGCLCGVAAMEASEGRLGRKVAIAGMLITAIWAIGVAVVWVLAIR
jgi:hypothetical protein